MFDPNIHHRRTTRLAGYDYTQGGAYFVTICTYEKRSVFGQIDHAEMQVNRYGSMIVDCWQQIPQHYPNSALDEWVVMPNHLHGILILTIDANPSTPATFHSSQSGSLSIILNRFKGSATRAINAWRVQQNLPPVVVWQNRFYDRIIRNERELLATRKYIRENPQRWQSANH